MLPKPKFTKLTTGTNAQHCALTNRPPRQTMGSDSHLARSIGEVANQKRRFDSCVIIFLIPLLVGVTGAISPTVDLAGTSPNNDTGISRMFSLRNEEILVSVSMDLARLLSRN